MKHLFIFSHDSQIEWYRVFAEAFREAAPGNKTVLFVHGEADVERGRRAGCYDIVVDMLAGFRFDRSIPASSVAVHPEIVRLEADAKASFFWDDVRTDRWARRRNDGSFVVQYLNHAFSVIIAKEAELDPVAALGEYTMAIYRLAFRHFERRGKRMLYPVTTRYFRRLYFETNINWEWDRCVGLYRQYLRDGLPAEVEAEIQPHYDRIVRKDERPNYTTYQNKFAVGFTELRKLTLAAAIEKTGRMLRPEVSQEEYDRNIRLALLEMSPAEKMQRMVRERVNYTMYNRLTTTRMPESGYGVYFFHFQPEYTTDALGRFYQEQQFLIRNIAAAMPAGMKLIVKEHPTMVGLRDYRVYEHVKANANVVLAHHSVDSGALIRGAKIIFTIVGTPALEAMWIGKPSIMFGRYAFADTNLISLCRGFWELGDMIREKVAQAPSEAEVRRHAMALLAAKYQASWPGQIPIAVELIQDFLDDRENFGTVKRSFIDELRLQGALA